MGRPGGQRVWLVRAVRAACALVTLVAPVLLFAAPASAHASLVVSTPADGDVLAAAPKSIHLTFSETIQLPLSRFDLQRPDGSHVALGVAQGVPGKSDEVNVPLNNLGRGNFILTWHAATRDTHIASGQFQFSLGAPLGRGLSGSGGGFSPFAWASGASRYLWYVVVGLTAGLLFSLLWVRRPSGPARTSDQSSAVLFEFRRLSARGLRLIGPALVVASIVRLLMLLIQAATNAGPTTGAWRAVNNVITSYQGRLWIVIIAAATLLFFLSERLLRTSRGSLLRSFGPPAAVLVVLCGLEAASGHAATRSTPVVPIA
ncbi:MAG TPA: copper resistance protein CopC, partial [Acidimicrobiales bacterium]|nr:copper resistance protein CopC [Acidimicrobiales bacterium]